MTQERRNQGRTAIDYEVRVILAARELTDDDRRQIEKNLADILDRGLADDVVYIEVHDTHFQREVPF